MPDPSRDVDPVRQYAGGRAPHGDRPWVLLNMVTSADGAVSVDGRSGGLGGEADREIFHALRTFPDVILVGSGTVRAEGYGPPRFSPADAALRESHDAWPVARIAVVTGSASLDYGSALFSQPTSRPLLVTTANAPADRIAEAAEVADIVVAGEDRVDPSRALSALGELGARIVLCEGGPSLNGQLLSADVVDELCLTVSPLLVAGSGKRIVAGDALRPPFGLDLVHVLEDDGSLFVRYRRPTG